MKFFFFLVASSCECVCLCCMYMNNICIQRYFSLRDVCTYLCFNLLTLLRVFSLFLSSLFCINIPQTTRNCSFILQQQKWERERNHPHIPFDDTESDMAEKVKPPRDGWISGDREGGGGEGVRWWLKNKKKYCSIDFILESFFFQRHSAASHCFSVNFVPTQVYF